MLATARPSPWLAPFLTLTLVSVASLQGCGGGGQGTDAAVAPSPAPAPSPHSPGVPASQGCDEDFKATIGSDPNTTVLLVKAFKAGDALVLSGASNRSASTAAIDICLVKLLVGPGNPGPASAPSTSDGIGVEVWLPSPRHWNERIRAQGGSGWAGGATISSLTALSERAAAIAGLGYVASITDTGHTIGGGSFAMNPDGKVNTVLWNDFAERAVHEQAVKTKALTSLFYGKVAKYAYWEGASTGGRQGLKLAQAHPEDFDGILAGMPAISWTRFATGDAYPQVVMKRDLGGLIATSKLTSVTTAAIHACGGTALGYLIDPLSCRYDPTKDATVLCEGVAGHGGVVGRNLHATTCVNLAEASAINKIWYGQTTNGSVPDPASDNGSGPRLVGTKHLWFGPTRGTSLNAAAGPIPTSIATDQIALELQDPSLAATTFTNATGDGADGWQGLSYAALANAASQGALLQPQFGFINTESPDLISFHRKGGKLIMFHGLADDLIPPQGSTNYYERVVDKTGGLSSTQAFFRLYLIPGLTHEGSFSGPGNYPLPQPAGGRDELFQALQSWTEGGAEPDRIEVTSPDQSRSLPLCVYPQRIEWDGVGAQTNAASYSCN